MALLTSVRAAAKHAPLIARDLTGVVLLLTVPDRFRDTGVRPLDPGLLAAARSRPRAGATHDAGAPRSRTAA